MNEWTPQQTEAAQVEEESSPLPVVPPLPDPPRTGILKGGKLWRGASTASGTSLTTTATVPSTNLTTSGDDSTATVPASVRFVHLNDAPADDENDPSSSGGQSSSTVKGGHNSAFQQLFPRARKLLQDLPEAEIHRLTATSRVQQHAPDLK